MIHLRMKEESVKENLKISKQEEIRLKVEESKKSMRTIMKS